MKKYIVGIVVSLLCLCSGLTALFFLLLGTQTGTDLIVYLAVKQMKGGMQISSARGNILSNIELTGLTFVTPKVKMEAERLLFKWESRALLKANIHVQEFSAKSIIFTNLQPSSDTTGKDSEPTILPDIKLPVDIIIDKLVIDDTTLQLSPDSAPIILNHAGLTLIWNKDGIEVGQLALDIPAAKARISGKLAPEGNYPLSLTSDIETMSPDYPDLTFHGQYEGNLQNMSVKAHLRGAIEADINGAVSDCINDLSWNAVIDIIEFAPAAFAREVPGIITGQLTGEGNLKRLDSTARLTMSDTSASNLNLDLALDVTLNLEQNILDLRKCDLHHKQTETAISLTGSGEMSGEQFTLSLNWQQLQWPLSGPAEFSSQVGDARLVGSLDDFHLSLDSTIDGQDIPQTDIKLDGSGNRNGAKGIEARLAVMDGNVTINGDVQWSPTVKWKAGIITDSLNPGHKYPEWPGSISMEMDSTGTMSEEGLSTDIIITTLRGTLRELPIGGHGKVFVANDTVMFESLELTSGKTTVTTNGLLGQESDLIWDVAIADFSDLLPKSRGSFFGNGKIQGDIKRPRITAHISGSSIVIPKVKVNEIRADANIDLTADDYFNVSIGINDLQSEGNIIEKLSLDTNGTLSSHQAKLFASHQLGDLSLTLAGGYSKEQWHGFVERLDLETADLGVWKNTEQAQIVAGTESATLETLCLRQNDCNLCVHGQWDKDNNNSGGTLKLSKFPLNSLSRWLPKTVTNVGGDFSLEAEGRMTDGVAAAVHAVISPGHIGYKTEKKVDRLPHQGAKLDLDITDGGLKSSLWLSIDSNIINAELTSPDLMQKTVNAPALKGKLNIDAENFAIIETLVPDIKNIDAKIKTGLKIGGTTREPRITGNSLISLNSLLIPVAGLELNNSTVNIKADNQKLTLAGELRGNSGTMALEGNALLDKDKHFPARLNIKADNFQLVNLPDITVFLSSDLLLKKNTERAKLSGSISVPKAAILLRQLPKGTETVSADVVIVQEHEANEPKAPLDVGLNVSLGKDVHFIGFGLNAYVDGQLMISAKPEEQAKGSGNFNIKQGRYRAYGQDLEIQTGVISFPGGPLSQPGINLRATRTIGEITVGINVIGPAKKPRITTFSNPPMAESKILSYLITGSGGNSETGAKLSIGRQINDKLSVSVGTDTKTGDSEFVTRYRLSPKIHVQTTTGSASNAADIFYTVETGKVKAQQLRK